MFRTCFRVLPRQPCRKWLSTQHDSVNKYKILFLGRDEFSCLVLQQLYQASDVWSYICIATHSDEIIRRRGAQLSVSPLRLLGESLKLPVHLLPHTKPEFRKWKPPEPFFEPQRKVPPPDHLIVTASFGRIVPSTVLNLFPQNQRLNIHPSLLPAYRGAAPLQHTIANGEKETGVCIIDMLKFSEGIDSGPIWASTRMPLLPNATFTSLREAMALEGGSLLVSVLRDMIRGEAKSTPQSVVADAPYAPLITFQDSVIDFQSMSALVIERLHRGISHQRPLTAYLPSGRSLQLHTPSVTSSYPAKLSQEPGTTRYYSATKSLTIRCAGGSVLQVPRVKQEAKALLDAHDWWNGVKGLGMVKDGEIKLCSK